MLEPGEVVVVSFDKIHEFISRPGVSVDGKLYISNYRVHSQLAFYLNVDSIFGNQRVKSEKPDGY